jgi:phosphoribosylanthranilate isomerase
MIGGVKVKVCGLTRLSDAKGAASMGADFLGFIFYPKSPRFLALNEYQKFQSELPDLPKVAVTVLPDSDQLNALLQAGFDYYQIHFPLTGPYRQQIEEWSRQVTPEKLWLAQKVGPEEEFDENLLPYANTFLWDTYQKGAFGGTGKVGDWEGFGQVSRKSPDKNWVLAGGLNPGNVREAIEKTGTKQVDLNSGVEKSPGVKDLNKLEQVRIALQNT